MASSPSRLFLVGLVALAPANTLAQNVPATPSPSNPAQAAPAAHAGTAQLPTVHVVSDGEADAPFNPVTPPQVNKSSVPLSETPMSITVVPRSVLDSEQAQTLADALHNVPGVVANQFGRRGWDDLIIRGQVASDSLFLDGLRTSATSRVAEQLYGLEQVEVLKGPASLLYGLVLPGGLVNMVSKRPQPEAFANADVTVGSHDMYQGAIDMGTPLSDNGKAAFRLNALTENSHDATDYVWFKNRWIAPSLSLDLGSRTDFTILTSYQERRYVRQQGLPLAGSVLPNPNGSIPRDRFIGEPGQDPYRAFETRVGYALTHRFDNGWTVNQNLRWQEYSVTGQVVTNGTLARDNRTLSRTATDQSWSGDTITLDTNAQRTFATAFGKHEVTFGTDYLRTRETVQNFNCRVGTLDVYNPTYGSPIVCPATPRTASDSTIRSLGFYVRDQVQLGERWRVLAGLRRDDASSYATNTLDGTRTDNPSNATTGSAAIMYELWPGVRPYVSYATSFFPNSGTDVDGNAFDPETGRQWEAGVKVDLDDGDTNLTFAVFDLRRRNVLQADPVNDGFSIAVGEQRSRGAEFGIVSDLGNGLSLLGGYAYTAAVITDDGGQSPSTQGDPLDNVPRHSFTMTARYRLHGALLGWELNGGVRGESSRHAYGYEIPGYTVADAGIAYNADHWRAALTVRNLFDKQYFAGGLRNAVALGDDRTVLLTLGYRY
ncbi:TonB-dependent siderophore receptor [Bordetella genomosp. 11]|uniref:TonB-dependent siderophore receptor n=1 Tax=Bordetella genomosp. 11 TaxID=1416808 RepID=A0A261UIY5_9BORD|nr:TonB-dependent siderophore receptor [Bordetella genomosp. 11]OZI61876.1 TonB-dependent siderophore receptor [Bordetella genomosp. 11]